MKGKSLCRKIDCYLLYTVSFLINHCYSSTHLSSARMIDNTIIVDILITQQEVIVCILWLHPEFSENHEIESSPIHNIVNISYLVSGALNIYNTQVEKMSEYCNILQSHHDDDQQNLS